MYNDGQMQQPAADHTMGHSIFLKPNLYAKRKVMLDFGPRPKCQTKLGMLIPGKSLSQVSLDFARVRYS